MSAAAILVLNGNDLSLAELRAFERDRPGVELDAGARERMQASADNVSRVIAEDRVCYGINTGFGAMARE
ncbi:MAG: aromatic amino acid lyase, partial [Gammaproteobacteria bacterium]